jgi:hypothetical protein
MANRDPGRARAQAQPTIGDEEINYEDPLNEDGVQGDGDEGFEDPESTALDTGEEQETGFEEDVTPQPSRAQNRLQTILRENAELRRRVDEIDRRPAAAAPATPARPALDPWPQLEPEEQFKARLALLPPDERMDARAERAEIKAELRFRQQQFVSQLEADKVNFKALCTTDPYAKRYAKQVEDEFNERMRNGQPLVEREILLNQILAKDMRSPEKIKSLQKRNAQAERRVASQTVRPSSSRSDAASNTGRRGQQSAAEARRARLEGINI